MTATPTRRQFGQGASALVLAFSLAPRLASGQAASLPGSLANNRLLEAWLRMNADGSATIFAGKVDLRPGCVQCRRKSSRRGRAAGRAPQRPRRGAKKAAIAAAASILTTVYHMLRDGTYYQEV